MLLAPTISTPAARLRVLHGVALPEVGEPKQEVLELVAVASMPRGYLLADEPGGLQLIREADGARLGIMSSSDFAARHAATLARMEALRVAQQEAAA